MFAIVFFHHHRHHFLFFILSELSSISLVYSFTVTIYPSGSPFFSSLLRHDLLWIFIVHPVRFVELIVGICFESLTWHVCHILVILAAQLLFRLFDATVFIGDGNSLITVMDGATGAVTTIEVC